MAPGVIANVRVATLATIAPVGTPHLFPCVFAMTGDTLYPPIDAKQISTRNLQRPRDIARDSRVSILIHEYWRRLRRIRLDDNTRVLTSGSESTPRTPSSPRSTLSTATPTSAIPSCPRRAAPARVVRRSRRVRPQSIHDNRARREVDVRDVDRRDAPARLKGDASTRLDVADVTGGGVDACVSASSKLASASPRVELWCITRHPS